MFEDSDPEAGAREEASRSSCRRILKAVTGRTCCHPIARATLPLLQSSRTSISIRDGVEPLCRKLGPHIHEPPAPTNYLKRARSLRNSGPFALAPQALQAVPILAQLILRKLTVQRLYLVSESPGPDKTNLLMIRFHDSTRYPCSYYV